MILFGKSRPQFRRSPAGVTRDAHLLAWSLLLSVVSLPVLSLSVLSLSVLSLPAFSAETDPTATPSATPTQAAAPADAGAAQVTGQPYLIRPELEELQKKIEASLQEKIERVLGRGAEIAVSVYLTEKSAERKPAAASATPSPSPSAAAPDEFTANENEGEEPFFPELPENADDGYLEVPIFTVSGDARGGRRPAGMAGLDGDDAGSRAPIEIESMEIRLLVTSDLDPSIIQSAESLMKEAMSRYNPVVTVKKYLPIRSVPKAPDPNSPQAGESPPMISDTQLERMKPFLSLLGTVLAAMIVALGILPISRAFKASANALAEAFKSLPTSFASSVNQKNNISQEGGSLGGGDAGAKSGAAKGELKPPPAPAVLRDYSRNLRLLKQVLQESPFDLVQALRDSAEDTVGLKWLIPAFAAEEQDVLRKYLGTDRIARLGSGDVTAPAGFERVEWLQDFVERVLLKRLQGGSEVQKALGSDQTIRLFLAPTAALTQAARQIGSPGAWRILLDLLEKRKLEQFLATLPPEEWPRVMSASQVEAQEIREAAETVLTVVNELEGADAGSQKRTDYYKTTLLDPVVGLILSKPLSEDEAFLQNLESTAPELVALVRRKIWTAGQLFRVPADVLRQYLMRLTSDQRVQLLFAMPEAEYAHLESMLPEGNARTIAISQVKKLRTKNDPNDLKAAIVLGRQFLDILRKETDRGRITLLDEAEARTARDATAGVTAPSTPETNTQDSGGQAEAA